ncbi:unnamed protein product, partial [Amoebophrya sp. A25]|eukprot:GSA25T00009123001.1
MMLALSSPRSLCGCAMALLLLAGPFLLVNGLQVQRAVPQAAAVEEQQGLLATRERATTVKEQQGSVQQEAQETSSSSGQYYSQAQAEMLTTTPVSGGGTSSATKGPQGTVTLDHVGEPYFMCFGGEVHWGLPPPPSTGGSAAVWSTTPTIGYSTVTSTVSDLQEDSRVFTRSTTAGTRSSSCSTVVRPPACLAQCYNSCRDRALQCLQQGRTRESRAGRFLQRTRERYNDPAVRRQARENCVNNMNRVATFCRTTAERVRASPCVQRSVTRFRELRDRVRTRAAQRRALLSGQQRSGTSSGTSSRGNILIGPQQHLCTTIWDATRPRVEQCRRFFVDRRLAYRDRAANGVSANGGGNSPQNNNGEQRQCCLARLLDLVRAASRDATESRRNTLALPPSSTTTTSLGSAGPRGGGSLTLSPEPYHVQQQQEPVMGVPVLTGQRHQLLPTTEVAVQHLLGGPGGATSCGKKTEVPRNGPEYLPSTSTDVPSASSSGAEESTEKQQMKMTAIPDLCAPALPANSSQKQLMEALLEGIGKLTVKDGSKIVLETSAESGPQASGEEQMLLSSCPPAQTNTEQAHVATATVCHDQPLHDVVAEETTTAVDGASLAGPSSLAPTTIQEQHEHTGTPELCSAGTSMSVCSSTSSYVEVPLEEAAGSYMLPRSTPGDHDITSLSGIHPAPSSESEGSTSR